MKNSKIAFLNNNKVLSNSSANWGAIHCSSGSDGYIKNCLFLNNFAQTFFINNSKVSVYGNNGGDVYFINSAIRFTEWMFDNNCCCGNSLHVSVIRSGSAIYSLNIKIKINKSCFFKKILCLILNQL